MVSNSSLRTKYNSRSPPTQQSRCPNAPTSNSFGFRSFVFIVIHLKYNSEKKKRKVTELYFNEYDNTTEIYTYNTKLKKRLTVYAATYPDLCRMTEDDEQGGLRFEVDKHRVSIRLTAPYSEERRNLSKALAINKSTFQMSQKD